MKPFLGIDVTKDKKNEVINGDEFIIERPSEWLTNSLENSSDNVDKVIENSKLPLSVRIVQWVLGAVGGFGLLLIFELVATEEDFTFKEIYQNVPWLIWLCVIFLIIWLILSIMSHKKHKSVFEADENEQVFDDYDNTCEAIFAEFNVPSNAKDIDVLSFFYKVKGEEIKVCEIGAAQYINTVFKAYTDSENLYLVDIEGKYAFPLSKMKTIKSVKKTVSIMGWSKDEEYNEGEYKQYKLYEDKLGNIICKKYHILELELGGEIWGIYFPCYELPIFEQLTGLTAKTV